MNMREWAKREVEIACERERAGSDDYEEFGEWDYGCACYESALKAFECLMEDGHSGMSIGFTKNILVRLIDGKPLTPIEDVPEVWDEHNFLNYKDYTSYQCNRMSSLFKDVYTDGTVKYYNIEQYYCIDKHSGSTYRCGLVRDIIVELFPITMPYMPGDPIKVYCADLLTDEAHGDLDTMAVYYAVKPDGEKIDIYRYFKEGDTENGWVEIDEIEFSERELAHLARLAENKLKAEKGE